MSTRRLLRGNMVDISTRDAEAALFLWPAARARAVCFYGGEVVGERCMPEIQGAGRDYSIAEALAEELRISRSTNKWAEKGTTYGGSCGPDTVEHVGSEGDGHEEIFRVADAHDIARFVLREPVRAGVHAGVFTIS